jgi:hypothetical protein
MFICPRGGDANGHAFEHSITRPPTNPALTTRFVKQHEDFSITSIGYMPRGSGQLVSEIVSPGELTTHGVQGCGQVFALARILRLFSD